ncbi:MAG: hypothetical protein A2W35_04555 [Chloroflexi bacterium RBG_16_57_11]|nr:MAG: hypothetical protein A2W35_04555 [Chloroflexi bacterium RBG_16_57_11]
MTSDEHWKKIFEAEIQQGEKARQMGNEGMARVCARRAAGALVGEYFNRHDVGPGFDRRPASAYDRLRDLSEMPGASPQVMRAAKLFLRRVTVEHTLDVEADLIAEARWLRQELLGE